jgi:type VII secretion protein EssB
MKDDVITLTYTLKENDIFLDNLRKSSNHDKLHVLKNIKDLLESRDAGYTYYLHPNNLVYDDNFLVSSIYVGYRNLIEPFTQDDEELLYQYKCLVASYFNKKYDFDDLYNSSLDVLSKTKFLEQVIQTTSIDELANLLEENFKKEVNNYELGNIIVRKSKYSTYKVLSLLGIIVSVISITLVVNAYVRVIPYENRMNEAVQAFVGGNYGRVISVLRNENIENLPVAQKYMLARAYLVA